MWHVVVHSWVAKALGELLPRDSMLAVLNRVRDDLENHADDYRDHRDAEDQDFLFDYVTTHFDGTFWHRFRFSVNDAQAAGYLFVEGVSHEMWRA